ncbi:MoaD/ThiS family protein [Ponticaulis sp.]|uniref:MoaD/ThiS family protein n=1 Tax=Ponticaulis sp. TaxID=2020902 RepID=UPI000B682AF5|nr:MoaD/ThiS family protein [Ponticaulis sp.]MAI89511.1 molybdopterin synthase sulfur carrier subunit [Ponticaulis sp.]OUY00545.1 MAG: molybdopterin synthase sulfur carrier subunit [Hyphomonadaceae bacterium TMED5]|tara:strand:+ start:172496 stop:172744 length:249 start_codon:yes stop_codon:yes gene_type:complete
MAEILYFGRMSDVTGMLSETVSLPDNVRTTSDIRLWAESRFKADGAFLEPTVRLAINSEIVTDPFPVNAGDEIAFMPPVGGG